MDVNQYIESGILEEYVMGATTPQETQEVECMAGIYTEISTGLEALKEGMEVYVAGFQKEPPESLKAKVLAAVSEEVAKENGRETRVINIRNTGSGRSGSLTKWMAAASLALLIVTGALYLSVNNKLNDASTRVTGLKKENAEFASAIDHIKSEHTSLTTQMRIIKECDMILALTEVEGKPDALVKLYCNEKLRELYVGVDHLPVPPDEKQYQLWAIVDGAPVDLGVFEAGSDTSGLQQVKYISRAQAFAVTLEQRGGSPVPTMEETYVRVNV